MLIMRLLPTGSYCYIGGRFHCWETMFLTLGKNSSSVARRTSGDDLSGTDDRPHPTRRIGLQMMDVIRHHQPIVVGKPEQKRLPCWKRCKSRIRGSYVALSV